MIILIGSKAANYHYPEFWPSPNDIDLIATFDDFKFWLAKQENVQSYYPIEDGKKFVVRFFDKPITEVEIAFEGTSAAELFNVVSGTEQNGFIVPDLDWLFTIKSSHKFKKNSPHFEKTLKDYHLMKYKLGAKIANDAWFKMREKETYNYFHPSLTNQTKESFFSDNFYVYDHDSIHESQKYLDMPAYKYYAADNDTIKSDKEKFFKCSHQVRLYGAIEEISTLALERSVIPYHDKISLKESWKIAFCKALSSITSGFFREWCYEHAYEILDSYPKDYYEKFKKALESGIVKIL